MATGLWGQLVCDTCGKPAAQVLYDTTMASTVIGPGPVRAAYCVEHASIFFFTPQQQCPTCGGQGYIGDGGYVACPACGTQATEGARA